MLIQRSLLSAIALVCLISCHTDARAQDAAKQPMLDAVVLKLIADGEVGKALVALTPAASSLSLGVKEDHGLSVAAGAIHRKLMQLSTDEQYDLLHDWSFPKDASSPLRLIASFVPQSSPPKAFAREIGERPRDSTFSVSEINGVRGVFCSGWTLVKAADDIGRLSRLTTELEGLTEKNILGADTLLALAQIAARRGDGSAIKATLTKRLERLSAQPLEDSTDFVLAVAAIGNEELRPTALQILEQLKQTVDKRPDHERAFTRIAHAVAQQTHFGVSDAEVLFQNPLKYWEPADTETTQSSKRGMPRSMWLAHEDHVLHVGGPLNSVMLCRFPIANNFKFGCDVQDGDEPETHGGLVYGGLVFELHGSDAKLRVSDTGRSYIVDESCPFARLYNPTNFNRLTFESADRNSVFAVNRQAVWRDPALHQNSPWIGLRSDGRRRPVFRNPVIAGTPEIPTKIEMLESSDLRGWSPHFFFETLSPFHANAKPAPGESNFDWQFNNGELQSPTRIVHGSARKQSLLRYQRPLINGEAIAYEFFYEASKTQVYPALGRIAFLIEETGTRIRWITDGPSEWTGLPVDNAILEPLNRRGPRKPPLKAGWNRVSIAIEEGKASLSLNGELIYQRAMEANQLQTFGLYRDPAKTAVRVRNAVMTGDWPKQLPDDFVRKPFATKSLQMVQD